MDLSYDRNTFIDGEAWSSDIAFDLGIAFKDQAVLNGDVAFDFARDFGFVEIHVCFHNPFRTYDDFAISFKFSFKDPVDADFSLESDFTSDGDVGSDRHFWASIWLLIFIVGSICLNKRRRCNKTFFLN